MSPTSNALAHREIEIQFPEVYRPLDESYRYKVVWGGRAAARSWSISRKLLLRGVERKQLFLCTRELQRSIKDSVHRLLKSQIEMMGLTRFYTVLATSIVGANGTEFIFLGTRHNAMEIKSTEGVDVCWIEEGHALTEESWDIIDPTIRKEGSEIWVSYNTRFKFDHLHQLFVINKPPPGAWVKKTSYKDNPFLTEVLLKQLQHMKLKDYEKYLNIWEGELKQLAEGAIFGEQITQAKKDHRFLPIPIQKGSEVYVFGDLGKNDHSAFWFMQKIGMEFRFIDYYENRLQEIEHYTKVIKAMPYNYGMYYLPHDADHDRLGMTKNIKQQFQDGGIRPIMIVPRVREKNMSIEAGRREFGSCWFHKKDESDIPLQQREGYISWLPDGMQARSERMERGIDVLSNYRFRYMENEDAYHIKPHHDWASNGADAFQQFALAAPTVGRSNLRNRGSHDPAYAGDY
jgi:phage terminase large subunit